MPSGQGMPGGGQPTYGGGQAGGADGGEQAQSGPQAGGDRDGDGIPDTAQASSQPSNEIDFSEEESQSAARQGADGGGAPASGDAQNDGASGGGGAGQEQAMPGPSASSYEERVAVLDRQLEGSMSEYDGMILRERRNVLNRAGEMGSERQVETFDRNTAYYDEGDLSGGAGDGQEGGQMPGMPGSPEGGGMAGDGERTVAQAGGHPRGSNAGGPGRANDRAYAPPADIPSGDDDDVVARQIREAAMYEDDPELREKLWEEYRKYKEQTRR